MYPALFAVCAALAWFDFRTRRIPNGLSLPLLAVGLWLHFPGTPATWLACAFLFSGWRLGMLGGGDAKLWMALLWLASPALGSAPALWMAGTLLLSAAGQLGMRLIAGIPLTGRREPAAWRTVPYAIWLIFAN